MLSLLFVIMFVLKLLGLINVGWLIVFSPIILSVIIMLLAHLLVYIGVSKRMGSWR